MTYREFISTVLVNSKAITSDGFIPPKFIYSETLITISDLIKQDKDMKRAFWRNTDFYGWKRLNCIELEEVPITECGVMGCNGAYKILKSKKKLPEMYKSMFGSIIKFVATTNYSQYFDPTNPRQWTNIQKRRYKDKSKRYYFITNGYLYIPMTEEEVIPLEEVTLEGFFESSLEVEQFNQVPDLSGKITIVCKSPLDYEIPCPSYLLNIVEKEILQKLKNLYLSLPQDDYANLNRSDLTNQRDIQNTAAR